MVDTGRRLLLAWCGLAPVAPMSFLFQRWNGWCVYDGTTVRELDWRGGALSRTIDARDGDGLPLNRYTFKIEFGVRKARCWHYVRINNRFVEDPDAGELLTSYEDLPLPIRIKWDQGDKHHARPSR